MTAEVTSAIAPAIHWWPMAMSLFGGLALFLCGIDQRAEALKAVAGERMKDILAKLIANRFIDAITGAFVTAAISMVFFGMGIMSDAMGPLRTYEPFSNERTRRGLPPGRPATRKTRRRLRRA
ncbi:MULTISPECIES: hypothetical protein [unclassified Thiocapsa]|uniref:hypothetical protein n=1 Tax=unclassified Thiocapsa TaxID=2641286 RepID=UPI0035B1E9DA